MVEGKQTGCPIYLVEDTSRAGRSADMRACLEVFTIGDPSAFFCEGMDVNSVLSSAADASGDAPSLNVSRLREKKSWRSAGAHSWKCLGALSYLW